MIKKKCIIFDMDGCLVDTERSYKDAWALAFKEKNIHIEKETLLSWMGKSAKVIDKYVEEYTGNEVLAKELRALREEIFFNELETNKVSMMPYAMEILDYLKSNKIKIGVASSTIQEKAKKILSYFNIYEIFDFKIFGDMVENAKPFPEIYEKAVILSGFSKELCLAFEDSIYGVMAANRAFVDVVYVPDFEIKDNSNITFYKKIDSLKEGIKILKEIDFF